MSKHADPDTLVADYLSRLDDELRDLPQSRRAELVGEIWEHIEEALAEAESGDAATRTVLDRLGDPADIAAEARDRLDVAARRPARLEIAALILLLPGS